MLGTASGVCYGSLSHGFFSNARGDSAELNLLEWVLTVAMAIEVPMVVVDNFLICSGFMLSLDVMLGLGDILAQWKFKMLGEHGRTSEMKTELLFAQDFCRLVESANAMLAPLILTAYSYILAGAVLFTYGALGMLFNSPDERVWSYFIGNSLLALALYLCAFVFSVVGNRIQAKKDAAMRVLHEFISDRYADIGDKLRFDGVGILSRLEKVVKISPYDFFEVSNTHYLGVIATHATYTSLWPCSSEELNFFFSVFFKDQITSVNVMFTWHTTTEVQY